MANPIKAARTVGGIVGEGAKNINPIYKEIESRAKKTAIAFGAGFAATSAWIGNEVRKSEENFKKARGK
jgi:predicted aconitase